MSFKYYWFLVAELMTEIIIRDLNSLIEGRLNLTALVTVHHSVYPGRLMWSVKHAAFIPIQERNYSRFMDVCWDWHVFEVIPSCYRVSIISESCFSYNYFAGTYLWWASNFITSLQISVYLEKEKEDFLNLVTLARKLLLSSVTPLAKPLMESLINILRILKERL